MFERDNLYRSPVSLRQKCWLHSLFARTVASGVAAQEAEGERRSPQSVECVAPFGGIVAPPNHRVSRKAGREDELRQ